MTGPDSGGTTGSAPQPSTADSFCPGGMTGFLGNGRFTLLQEGRCRLVSGAMLGRSGLEVRTIRFGDVEFCERGCIPVAHSADAISCESLR